MMRTRLAVLFLALAVLGCTPPCPDGYAYDPIAGLVSYDGGRSFNNPCKRSNDPPYSSEAVSPSSQCAAQPDDDPCVACIRASCCSEALACAADTACTARVQCAFTDAGCGAEPDATYETTAACLSAHCSACPRLP